MKFAFLDTIPWDFDVATPFEQPLGGSQSALCYLAAALAERGHEITLASGTIRPREVLGVTCLNFTKLPAAFWKQSCDAFVVVNGSADRAVQLREYVNPATPLVLWAHNAPDHVSLQPLAQRAAIESWDAIACVSDWHRSVLIRRFQIEPERVHVLRNAIAPGFEDLFPSAETVVQAKGNQAALAYTSAPFRGLDVLLDVWPKVHELFPEAELRVYSSLEIYRLKAAGDPFGPIYQKCRSMPGAVYIGSLPQPSLAEALLSCTILAYPSTFAETSCIVALEAMAAGLHVVTSDLGALSETTMGFGTLVSSASGVHGRAEFSSRYLHALVGVLREHARDPAAFTQARFTQIQAINAQWTWSRRAQDWERAVSLWKEAQGRLPSHRPPGPVKHSAAPLQLMSSQASWYSAGPSAVAPPKTPSESRVTEMASPPPDPPRRAPEPDSWLKVTASVQLADWLAQQRVSLAFTTNQAGKLLLLGRHPDGRLAMFDRTFARCQGLWSDGQTMWMSSQYQLWRFENALHSGELYQGGDRLYVPRIGYTTCDVDLRDIAVEASGRVIFVNAKFACLATVDTRYSFSPLWNPPAQPLAIRDGEERAYDLTGLGLAGGRCKYVSAIGPSHGSAGQQQRGGCIFDVVSGKTIVNGLSQPHSPRVYRNRLWVLNSGTGHFGGVDEQRGRFEPLTFCPGYLRGLAFVGDYAVVGLSRQLQAPPGSGKSADMLPFQKELNSRGTESICGIQVIDLRTGVLAHWLHTSGLINELYDVAVLPDVVRPMALGFVSDEIQRLLTAGDAAAL